jgi:hypothetical protein
MLTVVSKVAGNIGVLDTDDGVIEWVSKEELFSYIDRGIAINNVNYSDKSVSPKVAVLDYKLCNFMNGSNIFQNVKSFMKNSSSFQLRLTNNKVLKGKYRVTKAGYIDLYFSVGVATQVPDSILGIQS